jgi:hypothetical protein
MKLPDIQSNIIRWVSTCETWAHFDAIEMAVNNCLMNRKAEFGVDAVEEAEHEINSAVVARIKAINLQPVGDSIIDTDSDSAFEGNLVRGTDSINFNNSNQVIGTL